MRNSKLRQQSKQLKQPTQKLHVLQLKYGRTSSMLVMRQKRRKPRKSMKLSKLSTLSKLSKLSRRRRLFLILGRRSKLFTRNIIKHAHLLRIRPLSLQFFIKLNRSFRNMLTLSPLTKLKRSLYSRLRR